MPLRAPKSRFTIGTDICSIVRVKRLIAAETSFNYNDQTKQWVQKLSEDQLALDLGRLERFVRRILTPPEAEEIAHTILGKQSSGGQILGDIAETLAGKFATKEAIIKACSQRKLYYRNIIISKAGARPFGIILDRTSEDALHWHEKYPLSGLASRRISLASDENSGSPWWEAMKKSFKTNNTARAGIRNQVMQALVQAKGNTPQPPNKLDQASLEPADGEGSPQQVPSELSGINHSLQGISGQLVQVSVSHDDQYATAVCLAEKDEVLASDEAPTPLEAPKVRVRRVAIGAS